MLATITWEANLVTVVGIAGDDSITASVVDGNLVFTGSAVQIPYSEQLRLDVQLLEGNDSFWNNTSLLSTIDGGAGDDTLRGGSGRDTLLGGEGIDDLDGGAGDDTLTGGGQADRLIGGNGMDVLTELGVSEPFPFQILVTGTAASEEVRIVDDSTGYFQIDGVEGRWQSNARMRVYVFLFDGDDLFFNDTETDSDVYGGNGNDQLFSFADGTLDGGAGTNTILGSQQISYAKSNGSQLTLRGTSGDDYIAITGTAASYQLNNIELPFDGLQQIYVQGLAGNDTITSDSDILYFEAQGGDGNDALAGRGKSSLVGNAGDDLIQGTDQLDGIFWQGDILSLTGTPQGDRFVVKPGADKITLEGLSLSFPKPIRILVDGLGGDDVIDNQTTIDMIANGGDGDDALSGFGRSTLLGGAGNNVLQGSRELTQVEWNNSELYLRGSAADNRFILTAIDNQLAISGLAARFTMPASIRIDGEGGDDQIVNLLSIAVVMYGGAGNDRLLSPHGKARLYGDSGNDLLVGSTSDDELKGDTGNDILLGGRGDDRLYGINGTNRLSGGAGNDTLMDGVSDDLLLGGPGSDKYVLSSGVNQRDILRENDVTGADTLDLSGLSQGVVLTFDGERGRAQGPGREIRTYGGVADLIYGGSGDDVLHSHAQTTFINGQSGNDGIFGNNLAQTLEGGNGADRIYGVGNGAKTLRGGEDSDWIEGGLETNYIIGGSGPDTIDGGNLRDEIYGDDGDDVIFGHGGNDLIYGGFGADTLDGGEGNDVLWGQGPIAITYSQSVIISGVESSGNILLGGPGDDFLWGNRGPDQLSGGPGRDRIDGEQGTDTLLDHNDEDDDVITDVEIWPQAE